MEYCAATEKSLSNPYFLKYTDFTYIREEYPPPFKGSSGWSKNEIDLRLINRRKSNISYE